jgi:hypothetical protein
MASLDHSIVFWLGGDPVDDPGSVSGLVAADPGTAAPSLIGQDLNVVTDLDPNFGLCDGPQNMANAELRRLNTPAGELALIGDDPDYGLDIMGRLNGGATLSELASLEPQIHAEVTKDPRVADAEVLAPFTLVTSTLAPGIGLDVAEGPFELVVPIDQLTVEMLRVQG